MPHLRVAFALPAIGAVELQSLPLLVALARQGGHEVRLVEFGRHPVRARRELATFAPHVVAYSLCSNEEADYLAFNRDLKRDVACFSLFGGPHPTFHPDFVTADGVDGVCRGEGDLAFPLFLERFGTDAMYQTHNFAFRLADGSVRENPVADLLDDLDSLPFPARDVVYARSPYMARNPIKSFMAGRGCPNDCSYCFNHVFNRMYRGKGRILRTKSVPRLLAEIQDVARRYPLGFVRFHDDVFGLDRAWLAQFAEQFPAIIGTPFSCYVRANMVDAEYARLLKQAGCYSVCTAIECGNERLRNDVLSRRLSNERIEAACRHLRDAGLRIFSFNMVGVPGETEADMLETIAMNRRLGIDFADASVFQPYPGTRAFDYCRENGLLAADATRFESVYGDTVLNVDPALKQQIFRIHKLFSLLVDHPGALRLLRALPDGAAVHPILNLVSRLYFGYFLHKRIYASIIPFGVRLRGAPAVLLSRGRI